MERVRIGPLTKDTLSERCKFYVDDECIGEWHVSLVLQHQCGEFWANEHGKKLLNGQAYAGGTSYGAAQIVERRLAQALHREGR